MKSSYKYFVLYDGYCLFCGRARKLIQYLDWLHRIKAVNLYDNDQMAAYNIVAPQQEELVQKLHLIEKSGKIYTGFYACRKIGTLLPLLLPFTLLLYIPGVPYFGEKIYAYIARERK